MLLPDWIKAETRLNKKPLFFRSTSGVHSTKSLLRHHRLLSVCEEARCPNKEFCFAKPTATFMILGAACTRKCTFCAVGSDPFALIPTTVDPDEPDQIAEAAREMGLKYIVITSVTRDDLPDGGAHHFAAVIRTLKNLLPEIKIEVLTPDFKGNSDALRSVLEAGPDVFNHNMETVRRLYQAIRPQADYERSIDVLRKAKEVNSHVRTKSGLMLGLGETINEVIALLGDLRSADCDALTIGQYLRPTKKNQPVVEYIIPRVFDDLKKKAIELGFCSVASGPLVRSSMNAEAMYHRGG